FMLRLPPTSPPFPYTTLFRSRPLTATRTATARSRASSTPCETPAPSPCPSSPSWTVGSSATPPFPRSNGLLSPAGSALGPCPSRSEEHTSELQSREKLVCRLL